MELGMAVLSKVREQLAGKIKVEHEPKLEGRQVMMVMAPAKH
jgi:translation initiation factor IF-3